VQSVSLRTIQVTPTALPIRGVLIIEA